MKRFEEALQNYDLAILKNPEHHEFYGNKANTLKDMKRFEEALV